MSKPNKLQTKDICRYILNPSRSNRACARALHISPTTVAKYRNLVKLHQVDLERLSGLSNVEIEDLVQARYKGGSQSFAEPHWSYLCAELGKPGVTIALLYQEYVESHGADRNAELLSASSFGRRMRAARKTKNPSMRQVHPAGARGFVDFSGKHMFLTERGTGKKIPQEVFVASLGASQLIFATAVPSQKLPDWIEANVRALEYFGGAPLEIVPDNLKSAVTKPGGKDERLSSIAAIWILLSIIRLQSTWRVSAVRRTRRWPRSAYEWSISGSSPRCAIMSFILWRI